MSDLVNEASIVISSLGGAALGTTATGFAQKWGEDLQVAMRSIWTRANRNRQWVPEKHDQAKVEEVLRSAIESRLIALLELEELVALHDRRVPSISNVVDMRADNNSGVVAGSINTDGGSVSNIQTQNSYYQRYGDDD